MNGKQVDLTKLTSDELLHRHVMLSRLLCKAQSRSQVLRERHIHYHGCYNVYREHTYHREDAFAKELRRVSDYTDMINKRWEKVKPRESYEEWFPIEQKRQGLMNVIRNGGMPSEGTIYV